MRYLFRSAFKSVRRSPFQTIFLIFTVFLSAVLFAMISEMSFAVVGETQEAERATYGNANIVISTDGDADSAYIGSADVAAVLGDGDSYSGYMLISGYDGVGTVLGAVTDFYTIDGIFDFAFTEYGAVTSQNIDSAIFVTEDFAAERGLAIGDSYTVNVLGVSLEYTVMAINGHSFFGTYSFIVDARGALNILTGISPAFAVFDEENIPFNEVYIRTNGDVEQKIEAINASLGVKGWTAKGAAESRGVYLDLITTILIPLLVMFTVIIAGILVYFSMNIISEKRKRETDDFILAGMSPNKVALAFIVETFIYIALGTALGIAAAALILPHLGSFEYTVLALGARGAGICIGAELLVEIVASIIYFVRARKSIKIKNSRVYALIIASIAAVLVCFILSFFLPVTVLYILSVTAFVFVVALIFVCVKPICRGGAKYIAPKADKSGGAGVKFSLALKNCANIYGVHNVLRILSVLLSVIIVVAAVLSFTSSLVENYINFLDCDYIVVNAGEAVLDRVEEVEGTEKCCVCGIYSGRFENGINFYLVDVDDSAFVYGYDYAADDNEVYLPKTSADLLGIEMGDNFSVTISGVECDFILKGYAHGGSMVGYFNADYFGLNKNMVLVQASGEDYLTRLCESVSVYGAFVQTKETVFASQLNNVKNTIDILCFYMAFMCFISAIGAANLVGVSYARRKQQFKSLEIVGMTRADVAKMIAFEVLIIAAVTVVLSGICGGVLCFFLNNGLRSFGFAIF